MAKGPECCITEREQSPTERIVGNTSRRPIRIIDIEGDPIRRTRTFWLRQVSLTFPHRTKLPENI